MIAFCGSDNGDERLNMIGKKNGDCLGNDSTGMIDIEANLLVDTKHYDVEEQKFATVVGKPSPHDSSYE